MPIEITHYKGINNTPAYLLAIEGHAELLARGIGCETQVINWDQDAIVATLDDMKAGVILWSYSPHLREVSIIHGSVRPNCRGHGVYRAMWDALLVEARKTDAVKVNGTTHVDNAEMRAVAKALGRVEELIVLSFDLR